MCEVRQGSPAASPFTETITWVTDLAEKPDDNRTVLIQMVSEDVELVIDGFWAEAEGEPCWHDAHGWPLRRTSVPAWAEKPKGPRRAAAGASS